MAVIPIRHGHNLKNIKTNFFSYYRIDQTARHFKEEKSRGKSFNAYQHIVRKDWNKKSLKKNEEQIRKFFLRFPQHMPNLFVFVSLYYLRMLVFSSVLSFNIVLFLCELTIYIYIFFFVIIFSLFQMNINRENTLNILIYFYLSSDIIRKYLIMFLKNNNFDYMLLNQRNSMDDS